MKQVRWGLSGKEVSAVALGCMRLEKHSVKEAAAYLEEAVGLGINFMEHADIYGGGRCESLFAEALAQTDISRDQLWIQSKCAIVPGQRYDFSKEYILAAVDGILKRLNTEYLDSLLLHRPDALCEPEEVAEAFDILHTSGKVRHFGVSNHTPGQIMLLETCVDQPIEANQGTFLDNPLFPELNRKLQEIADGYGVSKTSIAAAWILRHPAGMQLIAGTMSSGRLRDIAKAADIRLTRQQWYDLYCAAGNILP